MIVSFRRNVTIEGLSKDHLNIDVSKGSSYYISYPAFLCYFQTIKTEMLSEHHFIVAANFTYGWMPTTLKFRSDGIGEVMKAIRSAMDGSDLNLGELETVKRFLNNSVV